MTGAPLSLYIHIPFCSLKCSYCDFNSYARLEELIPPFVAALEVELRLWAPVAAGRPLRTVFFGGGTPSLLPPGDVQRIMDALRREYHLEPDAEVTLEANPGTVSEASLRALAEAGVNRLSIGVQSFHDDELTALDRIHSSAEAEACFRAARKAGFRRINLDLIYGLPGQTLDLWQANVERALALGPEHLSLYALTVEDGTKLAHDVERGVAQAPDPDLQADMYEWAQGRLARAGFVHYEISNWARPGEECRHNLVYWRNGEWLAFGPGAHGHWQGYRYAVVSSPRRYIEAVAATTAGGADYNAGPERLLRSLRQVSFIDRQTRQLQMADTAILALRLNAGLDLAEFERRFGVSFESMHDRTIAEMTAAGLLERENGALRLTMRGRSLANEVFVRLLPD